MELHPSIRQPRQEDIIEAALTLWGTPSSETQGTLGDPVPLGYRLDHDIFYKPEKKWEPVDLVVPVGRSGICKRSSCLTTSHDI